MFVDFTFVEHSSTTKDYGNTLSDKTSHIDGSGTLTTDITGAVDVSFMIPNNSTFRFRSGTHEIKLMDVSVNREKLAGTIARGIYTAQGTLDTVHQDVKSTRILEVEGSKSSTTSPAPSKSGGGSTNHNRNKDNTPTVQGNTYKWSNEDQKLIKIPPPAKPVQADYHSERRDLQVHQVIMVLFYVLYYIAGGIYHKRSGNKITSLVCGYRKTIQMYSMVTTHGRFQW